MKGVIRGHQKIRNLNVVWQIPPPAAVNRIRSFQLAVSQSLHRMMMPAGDWLAPSSYQSIGYFDVKVERKSDAQLYRYAVHQISKFTRQASCLVGRVMVWVVDITQEIEPALPPLDYVISQLTALTRRATNLTGMPATAVTACAQCNLTTNNCHQYEKPLHNAQQTEFN